MFEKIFSSADKLIEAGEEIKDTWYRSRLAPAYIERFVSVSGIVILLSVLFILGNLLDVLPAIIPSGYVPFLVVIPVVVLLWIELDYHALMYHFTEKRVIEEHGIISKSFSSVPYVDITRVTVTQGPLERIFGVGDLDVEVKGTDSEEIHIHGIRHPQKFRLKITAQKKQQQDGGREQPVETDPQSAVPQPGHSFSREDLEAELGRIERRRQQLEQAYENGELEQAEYERRWYMIRGEEEAVARQLDALDAQTDTD